MNTKQIWKFGFQLMLVCVIAATALSFTYTKTKPVIARRKAEAEKKAIGSVFLEAADFKVVEKDKGKYTTVYDKDKNELGVAVKAVPIGYGGVIEILVGVTKEGKVSAVKILNQNETPGLGTKVSEPKFYEQFSGKKYEEIILKKDGGTIDAITAATISSRAVSKGVQEAVSKAMKVLEENKNGSKN